MSSYHYHDRVSQVVAAMLRRLGLQYHGNESYGKIRINGLTLRRWFQPKLDSPFIGKPGEWSPFSSQSRLGKGIIHQQRDIRTGNLSLDWGCKIYLFLTGDSFLVSCAIFLAEADATNRLINACPILLASPFFEFWPSLLDIVSAFFLQIWRKKKQWELGKTKRVQPSSSLGNSLQACLYLEMHLVIGSWFGFQHQFMERETARYWADSVFCPFWDISWITRSFVTRSLYTAFLVGCSFSYPLFNQRHYEAE